MAGSDSRWPSMLHTTSDRGELRRVFNERRLYERVVAGDPDVSTELFSDRHPRQPLSGDPPCTRSQMLFFLERGQPLALAHQYVRPDGTLGASGLPDPTVVVTSDGRTLNYQPRLEAEPPSD